jgi:hypothetical protein
VRSSHSLVEPGVERGVIERSQARVIFASSSCFAALSSLPGARTLLPARVCRTVLLISASLPFATQAVDSVRLPLHRASKLRQAAPARPSCNSEMLCFQTQSFGPVSLEELHHVLLAGREREIDGALLIVGAHLHIGPATTRMHSASTSPFCATA